MTKIDIISGFLGAGKTTLIQKLLREAFKGEQVVLIENEFGEIGIDSGFLREAGKPFVPYFDMPLQHAHPDILRRMGRPFSGNPQEAVDRIREFFPDAALRTTMMVGFPGETDEHFRTLMDFVE